MQETGGITLETGKKGIGKVKRGFPHVSTFKRQHLKQN